MVLLHLLHRAGAQVTVVHVNYQKRGEDSELDQQLVEEICRLYKVECVSVRFDASDSTGNFQAWAREKRYGVFRDLKREFRADAIVTAHHRDDQVETIYQRLMRGSGMEHWGGMQVYEQGLFRPLLELGKEDIQMVAEQNGILYRTDVSNLDVAYGRNFIRLSLEPELDRFFPGWKSNLLGLGQRAREFEAMRDLLLDSIAGKGISGKGISGKGIAEEGVVGEGSKLSLSALVPLPRTLWALLLSSWIRSISGVTVRHGVMGELSSIDSLQTGQQISIGMGFSLMRDRDWLVLLRNESPSEEMKGAKEQTVKQTVEQTAKQSADLWVLEKEHVSSGLHTSTGLRFCLKTWSKRFKSEDFHRGELVMDEASLVFPLTLRHWQDGDRIQPLGMEHTRLVSDLLTDRKVSAAEKKRAWVLISFDQTVCAVIFPHVLSDGSLGVIANPVRCTIGTRSVLIASRASFGAGANPINPNKHL